ncbi:MAG: 2-hydroxychromene-2-carboxylate isomerase [Hyphomicrobiales bacterium]
MPHLDFWYEFASTYSYPAAMRIEAAAKKAGVAVAWRPFLLGPILKAQGLDTSPFELFPLKGAYMWRDVERICAGQGLAFRRPDPFPQSGLLAARVALTAAVAPVRPAFSRKVYQAQFAEGRPIAEEATIAAILAALKLDAAAVLHDARSPMVKERLRAETAAAMHRHLFGAPSFVTGRGELFWGNDRLDTALAWAVQETQTERASPTGPTS